MIAGMESFRQPLCNDPNVDDNDNDYENNNYNNHVESMYIQGNEMDVESNTVFSLFGEATVSATCGHHQTPLSATNFFLLQKMHRYIPCLERLYDMEKQYFDSLEQDSVKELEQQERLERQIQTWNEEIALSSSNRGRDRSMTTRGGSCTISKEYAWILVLIGVLPSLSFLISTAFPHLYPASGEHLAHSRLESQMNLFQVIMFLWPFMFLVIWSLKKCIRLSPRQRFGVLGLALLVGWLLVSPAGDCFYNTCTKKEKFTQFLELLLEPVAIKATWITVAFILVLWKLLRTVSS